MSYHNEFNHLIKGPGTSCYKAPNAEGDAVEVRAQKVDQEYRTAAAKHDEEYWIDTATSILRRHGKVRGLVVGAKGEFSKDLSELIAKAANSRWVEELGGAQRRVSQARTGRVPQGIPEEDRSRSSQGAGGLVEQQARACTRAERRMPRTVDESQSPESEDEEGPRGVYVGQCELGQRIIGVARSPRRPLRSESRHI